MSVVRQRTSSRIDRGCGGFLAGELGGSGVALWEPAHPGAALGV